MASDVLSAPDRRLEEGHVVRITPSRGWAPLRLGELWEYRELLYFLVWRDLKVRYKQTVLGALWAILQPVLTMVVFSVFFGRLAKMPSDGAPYPLFAYAALVPWGLFANGLTQSTVSVVNSANLIRKIYFPRVALPIATVLSGLVDFALAFAVLIAMLLGFHRALTPQALWVLPLALLAFATALGASLWATALNVLYRDVRHVVPFVVQFWMFATPIAYPSSLLPPAWRTLYALNPMVGVVEGFRWALLGTGHSPGPMLAASSSAALLMLAAGALFYRRMERWFADVV
jgi:lipopolysaccharide transport system permease protein